MTGTKYLVYARSGISDTRWLHDNPHTAAAQAMELVAVGWTVQVHPLGRFVVSCPYCRDVLPSTFAACGKPKCRRFDGDDTAAYERGCER